MPPSAKMYELTAQPQTQIEHSTVSMAVRIEWMIQNLSALQSWLEDLEFGFLMEKINPTLVTAMPGLLYYCILTQIILTSI